MKLASLALFSLAFGPVTLSLAAGAEAQWSNAKRMAKGLPPLPPRRLYNAKVARQPAPSHIPPNSDSSTASSTASGATVAAYVINVVTAVPTPSVTALRSRQNVGALAGYLNQVAKITTTNGNVKFSLTTDDSALVHGLYPTDYQQPTASQPISEFICLANGHSVDQSRNQPITLSPTTGEYLYFGDCGGNLDQPAGSPPTHDATAVEPEYYASTRVWEVDPATGAISFAYVNPDGSVPAGQTAVTFWCPEYGSSVSSTAVFVTSNPQLFRDAFVEKYRSTLQNADSCYVNELVSGGGFFYTNTLRGRTKE
ncbi:hypothetical protein BDY19DRAFT_997989 [Irpex rosettiformis]|uniref:Uncharacterized protein n=1 Tax=Irpex rosettiformis TaxID=378272 RepID=A0ACB8TQQ6_9APHY|nr:hypothetical protein BDY19DRAFT_997989 [Irpex rosettiformis]